MLIFKASGIALKSWKEKKNGKVQKVAVQHVGIQMMHRTHWNILDPTDPRNRSFRRTLIWAKMYKNIKERFGTGFSTPCWIWQGSDSGNGKGGGYPRMKLNGSTVAVHRVMYGFWYGPIPPKKQIDHKCRNRMCINPLHLEMVTHKENQRRRDKANEQI